MNDHVEFVPKTSTQRVEKKKLTTRENSNAALLILKDLMKQKGITQTDLARRAGISSGNISRFFRLKDRCPSFDTVKKLTEALGESMAIHDTRPPGTLTKGADTLIRGAGNA